MMRASGVLALMLALSLLGSWCASQEDSRALDFTLRAAVSARQGKILVTHDDRRLRWSEPLAHAGDLTFPLDLGDSPLPDYDELWVDYQELFPENPSTVVVKLVMDGGSPDSKSASRRTAFAVQRPAHVVEEIDTSESAWVEKDAAYRLARFLGWAPDSKWRYTAWKGLTVVQRRFHRNLKDVVALDVDFGPQAVVEGLDLRIGTSDNFRPGSMVELRRPADLGYRTQKWHVDIAGILRERFPDEKAAYLQEIIAFVKDDATDAAVQHPLRRIVFYGPDAPARPLDTSVGPVDALPARTQQVAASIRRVVVDLRGLRENRWGQIESGQIIFSEARSSVPGGFKMRGVRLVHLQESARPLFLNAADELIRRWGGPFLGLSDDTSRVESPEILSYLPFSFPGPVGARSKPRLRSGMEKGGISFCSDRAVEKRPASNGGLVLDGTGTWLEVKWPRHAAINGHSLFFLGVPIGAGHISRVVLEGQSQEGVWRQLVRPNEPARISHAVGTGGLTLKLFFSEPLFHVELEEAVFFRPVLSAAKECFSRKTLVKLLEHRQDFQFDPILEGGALQSPAESLLKWPIYRSGGHPLGFSLDTAKKSILAGPVRLKADPKQTLSAALSGARMEEVENPWFKVNSVSIHFGPTMRDDVAAKLLSFVDSATPTRAGLRNPPHSRYEKLLLWVLAWLCLVWVLCRWSGAIGGASAGHKSLVGILVAVLLYGAGIIAQPASGVNQLFAFGGFAAVLALRFLVEAMIPQMSPFLPHLAKRIHGSIGRTYLACAFLALFSTALMLIGRQQPMAEQAAVVFCYAFAIGVVMEAVAVFRERDSDPG